MTHSDYFLKVQVTFVVLFLNHKGLNMFELMMSSGVSQSEQ